MECAMNYRTLLLARESRGLTQKQLAELVPNLNQGNYSKMEKGLISIPKETLDKVADVLEYPVSFFYKDSQHDPVSSFYYRKRMTMTQKDLSMLESKLDIMRMVVDSLVDRLDIPSFDIPSIESSDAISIAEIAQRIRWFLKIPKGPITNLINCLEKHGVIVHMIDDVPDKFDGITMFTNKSQPIIFINNDKSNDRKRFTIGHELGHLVMHLRGNFYDLSEKDIDREADEFSSEFNMPANECKRDLMYLNYNKLPSIKMYWRMSKAAILYRAKTLGTLTDSQYRYFNMQLSSSGQRKKEREEVDLDKPLLLTKIIEAYIKELNYTKEEICDLVGLNRVDFDNYFFNISHKSIEFKPKVNLY